MPITKSAQKAWRQSVKRNAKNNRQKGKLRDVLKTVRVLASQKKFDEGKKLLPSVYKTLDKVAKVGLIKKNSASRTKSRITKLLSK